MQQFLVMSLSQNSKPNLLPFQEEGFQTHRHTDHSSNHTQITNREGKWQSNSDNNCGLIADHKSARWQDPSWTEEIVLTPYEHKINALFLKKLKGRSTSYLARRFFSVVFPELTETGRQRF